MSVLTYGTKSQIVGIALAAAAALFAVDYAKHARPLGSFFDRTLRADPSPRAARPRIRLWMNHMCCDACVVDVRAALARLPWVGAVTSLRPAPLEGEGPAPKGAEFGAFVAVDVVDLAQVDFVALNEALHGSGMTAERIELDGVGHVRLEADLRHVCCETCSTGLVEGMQRLQQFRASGQFSWIDSVRVNLGAKNVVVFARYDRPVDALELIAALDRLGFSPSAVRVRAGDT